MEYEMELIQYGNPNGRTVIYFHGAPGGAEEGIIFDEYAKKHDLNIICPVRFSIDKNIIGKDYFRYLAHVIDENNKKEEIDIVGFSIGSYIAIETSLFLKSRVRSIHLISAAAPLNGGVFLEKMAGGNIFKIAIHLPVVFKVMLSFQRLLARFLPSILTKMLFSTAAGKDISLSRNSEFLAYIVPVLRRCFITNSSGYSRDIFSYVEAWESSLPKCTAQITLWHGKEDNWSPIEMASYLHKELRFSKGVNEMDGLSHYSCLQNAVPKICAQLNPL